MFVRTHSGRLCQYNVPGVGKVYVTLASFPDKTAPATLDVTALGLRQPDPEATPKAAGDPAKAAEKAAKAQAKADAAKAKAEARASKAQAIADKAKAAAEAALARAAKAAETAQAAQATPEGEAAAEGM